MKEMISSRMWPMLLVLATMPIAAAFLEAYAAARVGERVVILVQADDAARASDDLDEADDADATRGPVDEDHAAAREAVRRGDIEAGLKTMAGVAARHPDNARVAGEHGLWLLQAKRAPDAVSELTRARGLAPNDARIALSLGRALQKSGEAIAAEAELRRALALKPAYGRALLALGRVLLEADRKGEALEVLSRAASFGSNEERAQSNVAYGAALLATGRREPARAAFDQAIERAPARVEIRLAAARAYLETNAKDDAARATSILIDAVKLSPDTADVRTALGSAREALGDEDGAAEAYAAAVRIDPSLVYPRRRLLRISLEKRRFQAARAAAEQLLAVEPEEPEHHFLAGLVAKREGRVDEARARYRAAIDKAGGVYPEAYFNLGALERDVGDLDAAIAAYKAAAAQKKGYLAAENNQGLALVAAGRVDEAEAVYRSLLARDPSYVAAAVNLGKLYSGKRDYPRAIEAYRLALEKKPGHLRALLDLGVAYARSGALVEAEAAYRKLLDASPRSVSGWFNFGLMLEDKGDKAAARNAFARALALDDDHMPSRRRIAALTAEAGALDDALAQYEEILDRTPKDAASRLKLADIFRRRGDVASCVTETKRALLEGLSAEATGTLPQCASRNATVAISAPTPRPAFESREGGSP